MIDLLYFAWVKERVGIAAESIDPPDDVATVGDFLTWQQARGGGYAAAFADTGLVRVAVNQEHAGPDQPIRDGDEVAFFPPVTGG